jgi:hypothetical protein
MVNTWINEIKISYFKPSFGLGIYITIYFQYIITSGNPCLQGTDGFQVWHISSGHKVTSNLEHPLSRS